MIDIDGVWVSPDLFEEHFHCDLSRCKGACCVEGDAGAPIEETEKVHLSKNLEAILPLLPPSGQEALSEQGPWTEDPTDGEAVTPLVMGRHCAYAIFKDGITLCGMEAAWKEGLSDFRKPISCHLYPIRIQKIKSGDCLHYNRWFICSPACDCGLQKKIKVYEFCREALVRKYGADWYGKLEQAAAWWLEQNI